MWETELLAGSISQDLQTSMGLFLNFNYKDFGGLFFFFNFDITVIGFILSSPSSYNGNDVDKDSCNNDNKDNDK